MSAYEKRKAADDRARDLEDQLFGGTATAREAKEEADRQAHLARTREIGKRNK